MDYSLQHHSDSSDWLYSQHDTSLATNTHEPLSEPVPFEDFQFSFGLDPGFSAPLPLDIPEDPPALNESNHLFPMDYQQDIDQLQHCNDPALADNNPLLDENDQKVFSQFLDAFFVDKDGQISNAEQMAGEFSTMYDAQPPPLLLNDTYNHSESSTQTSEMDRYHVATSMFLPKPPAASRPTRHIQDDEDEYRRSSILQSLDQQKQFHQRLNRVASAQHLVTKESATPSTLYQDSIGPNAIFLQQSNQISAPFITKRPSSISQRYQPQQHAPYPPPERHHHHPSTTAASSISSTSSVAHRPDQSQEQESRPRPSSARSLSTSTRRTKSHKELLTEDEKRSNHIASEQKRRSTIRNGFKDLTDIVPTLKNINNSKSTVLFKAVDYIKYLEKRNNHLRDKMGSLEVRVKVEGKVSDMLMHSSPSTLQPVMVSSHSSQQPGSDAVLSSSPTSTDTMERSVSTYHPYHQNDNNSNNDDDNSSSNNNNGSSSGGNASENDGAGGVAAALLAHKCQQQQLLALQEQLQYHQRLLAQQDGEQLQKQRYNSMSSSSASSSSHSSPQSSDLYHHPSQWTYDSKPNHHSNKVPTAAGMHPYAVMEVDSEELLKVSA
ncbi:hypothetical protein BCR42DRAFT_408232 [Absidia repens]|uniref:BHLH domain-containing protein n=1 Tax=Absidia repens TaxID=90262 RepID=A0A1X2IPM3_9FUNG|nr:hypothetical protein BCR42DRAFT_408232 [Absidia repens]